MKDIASETKPIIYWIGILSNLMMVIGLVIIALDLIINPEEARKGFANMFGVQSGTAIFVMAFLTYVVTKLSGEPDKSNKDMGW